MLIYYFIIENYNYIYIREDVAKRFRVIKKSRQTSIQKLWIDGSNKIRILKLQLSNNFSLSIEQDLKKDSTHTISYSTSKLYELRAFSHENVVSSRKQIANMIYDI